MELIDILVQQGFNALPEIGLIDVSFDKVGIELKILNTNIRYSDVINTNRPITKNVHGVNQDIENLRKNMSFEDKFVVFLVFPITHGNRKWEVQLGRITCNLKDNLFVHREFKFQNGISGVIYYGKVASEI